MITKNAHGNDPLRAIMLFFLLYFGTLCITPFLAPFLQRMLLLIHGHYPTKFSSYVLSKPYEKIFDRTHLLLLAIALMALWRHCGFRTLRCFGFFPKKWRCAIYQFIFAASLVASLCLLRTWFLPWQRKDTAIPWVLLLSFAGGLCASFLEEMIFRGFLLRQLRLLLRPSMAILLSSLCYAYAHFRFVPHVLHPAYIPRGVAENWNIAVSYVTAAFSPFQGILFFNFFLLGCVLSTVAIRTNNLMTSIGLHGGIAVTALLQRKAISWNGDHFFLGKANNLNDSLATTIIFLVLLIYYNGRKVEKDIWP
jgi:membrane protease YdiL (CAAX protease family)